MVNTMDYCHLAESLEVAIKQDSKDLEEKLKPPKKRRRIAKRKHSEESVGILKYSCGICSEQFKKKDLLDRHMFSHTGKVRT
jgi:stress-induced morphogen